MFSTDEFPPMTLVLPFYNRRAWLISFWLVMSLGFGILAGIVLRDLSILHRIAWGFALTVVVAMPGLLRPRAAILPFRIWNGLARLFARSATAWITAVCFYVVFTAARRMGLSPRLSSPAADDPVWTPWPVDVNDRNSDRQGIIVARASENGWIADLAAWARHSRNGWAWCLLPFLLVLSSLEMTRDVEAPPAGIYTLY